MSDTKYRVEITENTVAKRGGIQRWVGEVARRESSDEFGSWELVGRVAGFSEKHVIEQAQEMVAALRATKVVEL